ncbi:MAG: glutathione S-transferase family protein [Hyphomicrobiales bacterium]
MILVGQYDSPFVRRVAVTLHHYHMPFERNALSVFRNAKAMRKLNPLVRVPALILESGDVLIDSAAIVDHLDEVAGPARALTPAHGPERRKVLQAAALAEGVVDKAGSVVYERYWHKGKSVSEDWVHRCLGQAKGGLDYLEQQCGAPWFIDSHLTQADVMIGCMLGYLKLRLPEVFPSNRYPRLHALSTHCEMREEFVKSRISPGEVMPARK